MLNSERLDHALRMVQEGFAVFPLRPGTKVPYKDEGVLKSSADETVIRGWFEDRPNMNYGVDTSNGVAIDVDGEKGHKAWNTLKEAYDIPDDTLVVKTANDGLHVYYMEWLAGSRDLAPSINVRGYHAYCVGPGCEVDGRTYDIVNDEPVRCMPPAGLIKLLPPFGVNPDRAADLVPLAAYDLDHNIKRGLDYLAGMDTVIAGERNNAAFRVACQLKDFGLSEPVIVDAMQTDWHCEPMLSFRELEKVVGQAFLSGHNAPGSDAPEADFSGEPSADDVLAELTDEALAEEELEAAEKLFGVPPEAFLEPEDIGRRDWLMEGIALKGHVTAVVAPGGVGKSQLATQLAVCVVTGDPSSIGLRDIDPIDKGPVLLISTEDDTKEKCKRLTAIYRQFDLNQAELAPQVHMFLDDRTGFKFARRDKTRRLRANRRLMSLMRQYIVKHGIKLVVIDPLVELHEGEENSNNEMAIVMDMIRDVARETGVAIIMVHHTTKQGQAAMAGNIETSRGASAITNACRLGITLTRATQAEADDLGLTDKQRSSTLRLDLGKSNYSDLSAPPVWLERVAVEFKNGDRTTGHKNERFPVLIPFDAGAARDNRDRSLFACLAGRLQEVEPNETGGAEITLADAVTLCEIDPMFKHMDKKALTAYLRDGLAEPVCGADGYTVQAFNLSDTQRARWVIQGWWP